MFNRKVGGHNQVTLNIRSIAVTSKGNNKNRLHVTVNSDNLFPFLRTDFVFLLTVTTYSSYLKCSFSESFSVSCQDVFSLDRYCFMGDFNAVALVLVLVLDPPAKKVTS